MQYALGGGGGGGQQVHARGHAFLRERERDARAISRDLGFLIIYVCVT